MALTDATSASVSWAPLATLATQCAFVESDKPDEVFRHLNDVLPCDDTAAQLLERVGAQSPGVTAIVHQHFWHNSKGHPTQAAKVETSIIRGLGRLDD